MTTPIDLPSHFAFPPYTHVPGVTPHPIGDPRGHSFGQSHAACDPPDWLGLPDCELFRRGCHLFNAGYYWEAHEAWEGVWMAVGRTGLIADFVKGLIKLAAAGVKLREGSTIGAQRHLVRAEELLRSTQVQLSTQTLDARDSNASLSSSCQLKQAITLVKNLLQELPDIPAANAGQPVMLLGQL